MIWLASFPRSGNTFLRNVLFEVYGLESSTFHMDPDYPLDEAYETYPFVKTHLLPHQLNPGNKNIQAVYLVRDGRDALCSMAHHRKDIVAPGSDYYENLKAAIIAERGTFFGGWASNVKHWIRRADIIMRFEDLIRDPIACTERLRLITDLPQPDPDRLPTFTQLKLGIPQYGSGKNRKSSEEEMLELSKKNFRKGKTGTWKEEMPEELHELFWSYHGDAMDMLGYSREGRIQELNPDFDHEAILKLGKIPPSFKRKYHVLIEADKILSPDNDGIKRYEAELLKAFLPVAENRSGRWHFDLFVKGEIMPFNDLRELISNDFNKKDTENKVLQTQPPKSLFQRIEESLVNMIPDGFIRYLQKKNIRTFHKIYDFLKAAIFGLAGFIISTAGMVYAFLYRLKAYILERSKSKQFQGYDLIHIPLQQHFRPFKRAGVPLLFTIHDLTHRFFPDFHTPINISNAEKGLRFAERAGAHIIAVSDSTRCDILEECSIPEERIRVIHEAAERHKFNYRINTEDTGRIRSKYGIPQGRPYFLCLSTIEPRKNLENTIKGFTLLLEKEPEADVSLVIAGKKGWSADRLFLHNKLLSERIIFTGFIDDEDLAFIYSDALALCYISFYEGFGLPLLEAMNCSTPVIYGNNSSMPEIAGNGGLPADPGNSEDIMQQMQKILQNEELNNKLRINALRQANRFSWRRTAEETLLWYEKIIKENTDKA